MPTTISRGDTAFNLPVLQAMAEGALVIDEPLQSRIVEFVTKSGFPRPVQVSK
jgi:hypothetical protein